jgi:hypothetical protein
MFITSNDTFVNDGLWKTANATEYLIRNEGLLNLSLTSVFAVDIKAGQIAERLGLTNYQAQIISVLAYEAVLPGSSYELGQVFGDRQGVTEQYPTRRVYPPVDVSFYIKNDYGVLSFFDEWMNLISPRYGTEGGKFSKFPVFKFNYPDTYECDINIVKFERNLRPEGERLSAKGTGGNINDPKTYTYSLINAFPSNIISAPLSYSQSDILRTTVTFNYDRFVVQQNEGKYFNTNAESQFPPIPDLPPSDSNIVR